jgi:long-chain acyl-CoA synthetase
MVTAAEAAQRNPGTTAETSLHGATFGDVLREHARSWPHQTALVCGAERHDYATYDERVNRLCAVLSERGVGVGGRVLWLGQNCHRILEALLACAKLGAGLCPANWRSSADELVYLLADLDPQVVLWQPDCEAGETFGQARQASETGAAWIDAGDEYETLLRSADATDPDIAVAADSPLLYMYTAAFTGRPRAAMLGHAGLLAQDLSIALVQGISPSYVYLNCGPLFHIVTFITTLATFHLAGTNVFTARSDAEEICRLIDAEHCTGAFLIGPTAGQIVELNADGRYDLSSLQALRMGKRFTSMISEVSTPWIDRPGGYGQTELGGLVTLSAYGDGPMAPGRPVPCAAVRIVDADGAELAVGETGEIVVRGPLVMIGYWGDDEETARRQRHGWHHTNDLGRRQDDGTIAFVGPKTELIKTGAENVYPAEVEGALVRHPAVAEAVVIGVPDPTWAQNVKAVVRLHQADGATADELIAHVRGLLASYKKPKSVVVVETFPRLPSGIIDREAVKKAHGAGSGPGRSS